MQVLPDPLALRQLMSGHLCDQVLEGTPVAEEAEVGQRAGGQQAAEEVERFGARGGLPRSVRLAFLLRKPLADRVGRRLDERAVRLEQGVRRRFVARIGQLRATVIEEAAARVAAVESDVACRLLERRDPDPAVLERLRGQGRSLLDRDMRTRQLGDRVVAVADEDPFVELLSPANRDHVVIGRPGVGKALKPRVRFVDELVQQHAAQALLGA